MKRPLLLLIFLVLSAFCEEILLAQETISTEQVTTIDEDLKGDGKREEMQRYFGYETLLFRYLTLPYDANININQQGKFVDIGFLLIAILPIVLLGLLYKNKKSFYGFAALLLIYLAICFSFSKIVTNNTIYSTQDGNWDKIGSAENKSITDQILETLMSMSLFVTAPLRSLVETITSPKDFISYPVLLILVLAALYWVGQRKNQKLSTSIILIVFTSYSFLWLLLSGGILWYGFLMIPLGLFLIGYFERIKLTTPLIEKYIKSLLFGGIALWAVMSMVGRISNIDIATRNNPEHYGKTILNGSIFPYTVGLYNESETLNYASPNLSTALERINSNDAFIYMVGTSYSFDIKNNISRIFQDNLLTNYLKLVQEYEEKDIIIDALKISGFKYIVVDLHTPSLDRTPEKSLTQKFQLMLNTLYQNPDVSLIGTDRIVEFTDVNGTNQRIANVYGEKLVNHGSYAIYEIL